MSDRAAGTEMAGSTRADTGCGLAMTTPVSFGRSNQGANVVVRQPARIWRLPSLLVVVALWITIVLTVVREVNAGYSTSSWQLSEWLIDYRGGFVRRGLPGEVLLRLHETWGVDPYTAVVSLSLAIYAIACALALLAAFRNRIAFAIIPMSFALGFPAFADQWMRKDVLLVLVLGLAMAGTRIRGTVVRLLAVNLLAIFAILCHEAFVFIGLPILVVLLAVGTDPSTRLRSARWVPALVQLAPAIAAGALVFIARGSPETANTVWASWAGVPFPQGQIPGDGPRAAVQSLGWTPSFGLRITRDALATSDHGIPARVAWFVTIVWVFLTAFALTAIPRRQPLHRHRSPAPRIEGLAIGALLVFVLACTIPLYVIGLDYGRWIFFWIAATLCILAAVPHRTVHRVFGSEGIGGAVARGVAGSHVARTVIGVPSNLVARTPVYSDIFVVLSLVLAVPPAFWRDYENFTPIALLIKGFTG